MGKAVQSGGKGVEGEKENPEDSRVIKGLFDIHPGSESGCRGWDEINWRRTQKGLRRAGGEGNRWTRSHKEWTVSWSPR